MPDVVAGSAVRDALASGAAKLAAAACETPRLDAEVLLGSVLGVGRERLVIDSMLGLDRDVWERFFALIARREAREPVAYITGVKEFRRLSLTVDRRVLIPRPETELLVGAGLSIGRGCSVVDVGTGSGALALALKDERPDLAVTGVDVSPDALAVARRNRARLRLDVRFAQADLLDGVAGPFDAVLANLPYVAADGPPLSPEISCYEPSLALDGGPDGLELVRRLVSMLHGVPLVALEVGFDQAAAVSGMLRRAGFSVSRVRDLAGHERVVMGRR